MPIRGLLVFTLAALYTQTALAQPPTNDVASCSLLVDPTAQRLCIESAQQSRPAATFDPTAQKLRMERRPPPGRDALSVGGAAHTSNNGIKPGASRKGATPESYRQSKWRLQIP